MIAQIYCSIKNASNKLTTDQHILSLDSHCDVNGISLQELDFDKLKSFVLFPDFIVNLEIFVQNLIMDKLTSIQTKFRYISYLLCVKIFSAKNSREIEYTMKSCFDMSLFVKFCNNYSHENNQPNNECFPLELPIFRDDPHQILRAMLVLFSD